MVPPPKPTRPIRSNITARHRPKPHAIHQAPNPRPSKVFHFFAACRSISSCLFSSRICCKETKYKSGFTYPGSPGCGCNPFNVIMIASPGPKFNAPIPASESGTTSDGTSRHHHHGRLWGRVSSHHRRADSCHGADGFRCEHVRSLERYCGILPDGATRKQNGGQGRDNEFAQGNGCNEAASI